MVPGLSTTMKLRTLGQSKANLVFLLLALFTLSYLPLRANPQYSLIVSSGPDVRVYNSQFQELLYYKGNLQQLTVNLSFDPSTDLPQNSRILKAQLPFAWRLTTDAKYLFGVDPSSEGIMRVNLLNRSKNESFTIAPNRRLLQVLSAEQWLIVENVNSLYIVSIYNIKTETMKQLYQSRFPIYEAIFDLNTSNLLIFTFEESSEYTDIARQFYRLRRLNWFVVFNTRTNRRQHFPGAYPTYNALNRSIIYFNEGQAMLYNMDTQKTLPLPLEFTPLYSVSGDWPSVPQVIMLPDANFVLWERKQDGFHQLMLYNEEGVPIKIILNQQSGPVSLQLVKKIPEEFFSGEETE